MRNATIALPIALAAAIPTVAGAQTAAPPVFARCSVCHVVATGKPSGIGPNLAGAVGRKAGSLPGYSYSAAMKASGITWTKEAIATFIANPQGVVKGTKMYFPGLADPKDRAAIVAYLQAKH